MGTRFKVRICAIMVLVAATFDLGCATKPRAPEATTSEAAPAPTGLEGEVSLKTDRSDLDKFRTEIPEEVKKQNDEIATILSFINRDSEEDPSRIRERFNTALRKKREATDKQLRRARENFSKNEKRDREEFLKKSKEERDDYLGRQRTADDRKKFFEDQEDKRKTFFADQNEKRKDFESRVQDERKALEDANREKQNTFNQELREYQTRFTERKRQTEIKKRMEQKSRELERAGRPVMPVTPPKEPVPMGGIHGPPDMVDPAMESLPGSAAAGAGKPAFGGPGATPAQNIVTPGAAGRPTDPLKEFEQIPAGPGVPLAPGSAKKGR